MGHNDNGGSGFSAWTLLNLSGSGGNYTWFYGQGDPSFGIYAGGNSGVDFSSVERSFSQGNMIPGQTFSVDIVIQRVSYQVDQ